MDAETIKKINKLAKNLKAMNLVGTMEEAAEKARRIIMRSKEQKYGEMLPEKTIKEMKSKTRKEQKDLDTAKKELKELTEQATKDDFNNEELLAELEKVEKGLEELEKNVQNEEKLVKSAEKVIETAKTTKEKYDEEILDMDVAKPEIHMHESGIRKERAQKEVKDEPAQNKGEIKEPEDKEYHEKNP